MLKHFLFQYLPFPLYLYSSQTFFISAAPNHQKTIRFYAKTELIHDFLVFDELW